MFSLMCHRKDIINIFLKERSPGSFFLNSEAEHATSMWYDFKSDDLLHLCIYGIK